MDWQQKKFQVVGVMESYRADGANRNLPNVDNYRLEPYVDSEGTQIGFKFFNAVNGMKLTAGEIGFLIRNVFTPHQLYLNEKSQEAVDGLTAGRGLWNIYLVYIPHEHRSQAGGFITDTRRMGGDHSDAYQSDEALTRKNKQNMINSRKNRKIGDDL